MKIIYLSVLEAWLENYDRYQKRLQLQFEITANYKGWRLPIM